MPPFCVTLSNGEDPDNTRWTGEKASTFLKLLARSGKVAPSARAVGMSRQAAYRLRARAPRFAEFWDRAMQAAQRQRNHSDNSSPRGRKPVHPLLARSVTLPARDNDTSRPSRSHRDRAE